MKTPPTSAVAPLDYAGGDTYREQQWVLRREFTLAGDRLVIHSKKPLGSESEVPIALRFVDPVHARIWKRTAGGGIGSLLLAAIFGGLAFFMMRDPMLRGARMTVVIDVLLALMCLGSGLLSIRRTEFAAFGHSGGPQFDIARSGPDQDRFDAFVSRIVDRVNGLRLAEATSLVANNDNPAVPPSADAATLTPPSHHP